MKLFKNNYHRRHFMNMFMTMLVPFMGFVALGITGDEAGGGTSEGEDKLLAKIKKKNEEQLEGFRKEFQKLANESKAGLLTEDEFKTKMDELTTKLKDFDGEKFKNFQSTLEKMEDRLKAQGTKIKEMEEGKTKGEDLNSLRSEIEKALKSDDYQEFIKSGGKKKIEFGLKTVSVGTDYTGTSLVHITSRDPRVVDHPQVTRLNVRDLLTVMPTDLPYLAFSEVYSWTRGVIATGENTALAASAFKVRESTVDAKRIGTHVPISKRMMKSVTYVLNHLMQRLPAQVKYYEDYQLLWGDGAGNNVTGIFATATDFATLINTAVTGAAGSVTSVATNSSGTKTIVTLTANQLINNGDKITFANATNAGYNDTFTAIVIAPTKILIEEAYVVEADTSAWTFTVSSPFKTSIEAAQQIDVLKVAKTLVTQQEYAASGYVLNPVDATLIETLKGNDEHYIEVQRTPAGILMIGGLPVVETTAMPAGKFAVADWAMAAALLEFTGLVLEFSESTTEKLGNYVEAIIQEEILFPIYNKYMFVVGDFTTAITAIKSV